MLGRGASYGSQEDKVQHGLGQQELAMPNSVSEWSPALVAASQAVSLEALRKLHSAFLGIWQNILVRTVG